MIGSLGTVVFEVSADMVRTFSDFKRDSSSVFASHDIINGKPLLQHTGKGLQTVSFSVSFRADLGADPRAELAALRRTLENGEANKLFIGDAFIGTFVLENMSETYGHIDSGGRLYSASASLSLREYVSGGLESYLSGVF